MYIPGFRAWGPGRSTTIIKNTYINEGGGGCCGHSCGGGGVKGLGWFAALGFMQGFFGGGTPMMNMPMTYSPYMQQPSWLSSWFPGMQQPAQLTSTNNNMDNLNKLADGKATIIDEGNGKYTIKFEDGTSIADADYVTARNEILARSASPSERAQAEADELSETRRQSSELTDSGLTRDDVQKMYNNLDTQTKKALGAKGFILQDDCFKLGDTEYDFDQFANAIADTKSGKETVIFRGRNVNKDTPVDDSEDTAETNEAKPAVLRESPGWGSWDAWLEVGGKTYKFKTEDDDYLNYGKFEVKDNKVRVKVEKDSDYKVKQLVLRGNKEVAYEVKTDDNGKMTVIIGEKEIPLDDIMSGKVTIE